MELKEKGLRQVLEYMESSMEKTSKLAEALEKYRDQPEALEMAMAEADIHPRATLRPLLDKEEAEDEIEVAQEAELEGADMDASLEEMEIVDMLLENIADALAGE